MERNYGGLIWTNHALQRLRERGIRQGDAWATWNRPEQSRKGSGSQLGAWVYYRTYGSERIEVVAKQDEYKKWIIISVWSKRVDNNQVGTDKPKISFLKRLLNLLFK
jgi:hypothetical protein